MSGGGKAKKKNSWRRILYAALFVFAASLLTELFIRLDLTPILVMLPTNLVVGIVIVTVSIFASIAAWLVMRRRFQFSLASIFILAAIVVWPLARITREASKERQLAEARRENLNRLAAFPIKSLTLSGRYTDGFNDHKLQVWLAGLAVRMKAVDPNSIPYEITVVDSVDLSNTSFGDDDIPIVLGLGTVRRLDLSSTQITDASLIELAKLESLRELRLNKSKITSEASDRLRMACPDLKIVTD